MSIGFGSKPGSLSLLRQLDQVSQRLGQRYERLSSGSRVNSPSDDPVAIALQSRVSTDHRVFSTAIRNVNDGVSMLSVAEDALTQLQGIVQRITELANQASNGTFTSSQRSALDTEAQSLRNEWNRIVSSTSMNGQKLLDGTFISRRIQAGFGVEESMEISVGQLLGRPAGDGTFQAKTTFIGGNGSNILAAGDVTGDGVADIVTFGGTTASVWTNNGSGNFSITNTHTAGSTNRSASLVDVDGDGKLDIVDAAGFQQQFGVSLGNGNGTFKTRIVTTSSTRSERSSWERPPARSEPRSRRWAAT